MSQPANTYKPDYTVPPGAIIEEHLESRGITKRDFAQRTGFSEKTINQLIHGNAPLTADKAILCERVLGVSAQLWSNLESQYRLFIAQQEAEEEQKLHKAWARKFPLRELANSGYIPKTKDILKQINGLVQFLGVGSPDAFEAKYLSAEASLRHSKAFHSSKEALASWMRIGEIKAEQTSCPPYNDKLFRQALNEIRSYTISPPDVFEEKMIQLCNAAGVVLAFVEEFAKTRISGMARWITPDKALIILSLRHKAEDHFWFSFFHEAAHVLLHNKRHKKKIFLDEVNYESTKLEKEADKFASDILIPLDDYNNYVEAYSHNIRKGNIIAFARNIGISPGIVVGRLHHDEYLNYSWFNDLIMKFEIVKETAE